MEKIIVSVLIICTFFAFVPCFGEEAASNRRSNRTTTTKREEQTNERQIKQLVKDTANLNKDIRNLSKQNNTLDSLNKHLLLRGVEREDLHKQQIQEKNNQIQQHQLQTKDNEKRINQFIQDTIRLNKEIRDHKKRFENLDSLHKQLILDTAIINKQCRELKQAKLELENDLSNLKIYFRAESLLTQQFNSAHIRNTLEQLDKIEIRPQLQARFMELRRRLRDYNRLNNGLRHTINEINKLDQIQAGGSQNSPAKQMKLKEILFILGQYMYNNYAYVNNPYLSDIVTQILIRKYENADAPIMDLLERL